MSTYLTAAHIDEYRRSLIREERSRNTIDKYIRDVRAFALWLGEGEISREAVVGWKHHLLEQGYAPRSVNSMLASVHSLLNYLGLPQYKTKVLRLQRQTWCTDDRQLTRAEYIRLLKAAAGDRRLSLILQTICATGIRVSELQYFTLRAVRRGEVVIRCKGKTRRILLPRQLQGMLAEYAAARKIHSGPIFITRAGKPIDRTVIWAQMKRLCKKAAVRPSKVFPHNLRKLFARVFYRQEKDIAKLADLLGHSSIDTTRIYILSTGAEHRRKLEKLGLLLQ